jgi:hypothetical protein
MENAFIGLTYYPKYLTVDDTGTNRIYEGE